MTSSPALQDIIRNVLSCKSKLSYSPALKDFACSLLFYSASAYRYVRESFLKSLPSPQTVRRWFSKIDFSPGISSQILISIRDMIEKERKSGKELQFGLQVDEMSVKKLVELRNGSWHGVVDIGTYEKKKNLEEASYALVFMLVCLNGHFKTPIAYYFVKSLCGSTRANILKEILLTLHEHGISEIRSLTFDGASTNLSMVAELGADVKNYNDHCFFSHPATDEPIIVIPDVCHMLKLIRNATDHYKFLYASDEKINWHLFIKLVQVQEEEGMHLGTKIRRRHIDFHHEKMKVKLAAQVLSTSVSHALLYLESQRSDFEGAKGTATFSKNINDAFDILNSKSKFGKNEFQNALSKENLQVIEEKSNDLIKYITTIKCIENNMMKNILESKRYIGFWGFIVALRGVLALAKYVCGNETMSYLLTYKLSQDHLETFFSCVRRMGGFNNNPSCYQFQCAYKKLVTHVNSVIVPDGNCKPQDETEILKMKNTNHEDLADTFSVDFDHDYISSKGWCWTDYQHDVVIYIAGYIVRSIKHKINCTMCLENLEDKSTTSNLINIKNLPRRSICEMFKSNEQRNLQVQKSATRSGLVIPSFSVIEICKICEKTIRGTQNLFSRKNIINYLVLRTRLSILPMQLFENMDCLIEKDFLSSHKVNLIYLISKKYFTIRLHHEARSMQDKIHRIRTFHNRLVLFKNQ